MLKSTNFEIKDNAISLRWLVGNRNSKAVPNPKREMFVCKKWRARLKNHKHRSEVMVFFIQ